MDFKEYLKNSLNYIILILIIVLILFYPFNRNGQRIVDCERLPNVNCSSHVEKIDCNESSKVFATKTRDDNYWVLISPEAGLMSFEKKKCLNCPRFKFYLNVSQVHETHTFLQPCFIVGKCDIVGWPPGLEIKDNNCAITVAMRLSKMQFCLDSDRSIKYAQYDSYTLGIYTVNLLFISDMYFNSTQ